MQFEIENGVEGKLVAHDKHSFELKLGYVLDQSHHHNNYRIELYYFIRAPLKTS